MNEPVQYMKILRNMLPNPLKVDYLGQQWLMNKVRVFWSIDCWRDESEQVLTERLKYFAEQKDKLNQSCPQVPRWAYKIARRGIKDGEGDYAVDKNKPAVER